MPRPTKGEITEHVGKDGQVYRSLRFTAYGKRRRVPLGVVSTQEAETALRHTLADVERGVWQPPAAVAAPPEPKPAPTFGEFGMEWWTLVHGQFAPSTRADYWWRLTVHLAPYFGELRLDSITFDTVERYIAAKLAEDDPLSARSINMTLTLLGAILERAVERELIARNPAKGKARRVRERSPARSYLDGAAQIQALLDAAGQLDASARSGPHKDRQHVQRRAMLATLTFAGLRIGELCRLRWRDVDLAGGWLHVGQSKTDAGQRKVKIRGALRDELADVRGRHRDAPQDAYVFATATGSRMSDDNFRSRVLGRPPVMLDGEQFKPGTGALGRACKQLEAAGLPPLPKLTPHSLRRTFCSLLYALGEDPGTVMDEMGHTDPALALRVYRQAMRRGEREKAELRELVEGSETANSGQRNENPAEAPVEAEAA
jgi:integrase